MENLFYNIGYIGWTEDAKALAAAVAEKHKEKRSQYVLCPVETQLPEYVKAVKPVDRKTVSLSLRLRHVHVQQDVRIFKSFAEAAAVDLEMMKEAVVYFSFIPDKLTLDRNADQVRQIHQCITRVIKMKVEFVPQKFFPEAIPRLDPCMNGNDRRARHSTDTFKIAADCILRICIGCLVQVIFLDDRFNKRKHFEFHRSPSSQTFRIFILKHTAVRSASGKYMTFICDAIPSFIQRYSQCISMYILYQLFIIEIIYFSERMRGRRIEPVIRLESASFDFSQQYAETDQTAGTD